MDTIDVSSKALSQMARQIKTVPTNISCHECNHLVAGLLPNNKANNFIYGVIIPHTRIVCGIHEKVVYIPHEETICFCGECSHILTKISRVIKNGNASHLPINGGYFITISELERNGNTKFFSRFQGSLEEFQKIMLLLKKRSWNKQQRLIYKALFFIKLFHQNPTTFNYKILKTISNSETFA